MSEEDFNLDSSDFLPFYLTRALFFRDNDLKDPASEAQTDKTSPKPRYFAVNLPVSCLRHRPLSFTSSFLPLSWIWTTQFRKNRSWDATTDLSCPRSQIFEDDSIGLRSLIDILYDHLPDLRCASDRSHNFLALLLLHFGPCVAAAAVFADEPNVGLLSPVITLNSHQTNLGARRAGERFITAVHCNAIRVLNVYYACNAFSPMLGRQPEFPIYKSFEFEGKVYEFNYEHYTILQRN
ncbi:hypothetical protein BDN72DRAFT_262114 [Pluteus cervinus]|uniref:Uncharacterized protein n=1 Tax=Pluteus cervinus TaxID=181527 RepID=A0ACD3AFV9_9AGAR|nr:hypothetical protein BDN72DRAFT_262114 [Pluteus cervinus]